MSSTIAVLVRVGHDGLGKVIVVPVEAIVLSGRSLLGIGGSSTASIVIVCNIGQGQRTADLPCVTFR